MTHDSLLDYKNKSFVITDLPTDVNVDAYVKTLKSHGVKHLVRVCEPTYDTKALEDAGIVVHDWGFDDGDPPPADVISEWLKLDASVFDAGSDDGGRIAVHCVAGLGRAPVMVALSLIETGMSPEDAVLFIREKRRGAINKRQLIFLRGYKRKKQEPSKCVCM